VPASVFLQRSDVPGAVEPMQTYVGGLPPWCGLPRLSLAELRAAGGWMVAYIQAGASAHGRVTSTIEVFRKEAVAQSWMGMLREQVARCPQDVVGLATYRNQLLDTPIPSEPDSVLISVSSFGLTTYYAVFRRGDVIEVVANTAPGGLGDRLATVHLATRASARLAAWRR
jgi:hypothetical protein